MVHNPNEARYIFAALIPRTWAVAGLLVDLLRSRFGMFSCNELLYEYMYLQWAMLQSALYSEIMLFVVHYLNEARYIFAALIPRTWAVAGLLVDLRFRFGMFSCNELLYKYMYLQWAMLQLA